jgi:hypothetical protein
LKRVSIFFPSTDSKLSPKLAPQSTDYFFLLFGFPSINAEVLGFPMLELFKNFFFAFSGSENLPNLEIESNLLFLMKELFFEWIWNFEFGPLDSILLEANEFIFELDPSI